MNVLCLGYLSSLTEIVFINVFRMDTNYGEVFVSRLSFFFLHSLAKTKCLWAKLVRLFSYIQPNRWALACLCVTLPQHCGSTSQHRGRISQHCGRIPQHRGSTSQHCGRIPQHRGSIPQHCGSISQRRIILSHLGAMLSPNRFILSRSCAAFALTQPSGSIYSA